MHFGCIKWKLQDLQIIQPLFVRKFINKLEMLSLMKQNSNNEMHQMKRSKLITCWHGWKRKFSWIFVIFSQSRTQTTTNVDPLFFRLKIRLWDPMSEEFVRHRWNNFEVELRVESWEQKNLVKLISRKNIKLPKSFFFFFIYIFGKPLFK